MDELELRVAWQLHVGINLEEFESVIRRYREPHRSYHGVRHIRWVVHHARQLANTLPVIDLGAVIVAAFYHDAIYDPTADDNEATSARLAASVLREARWLPQRIDHVTEMIEATAAHNIDSEAGIDPATAVLLAADLAVLAAEPTAYRTYQRGVRAEYAHVNDADWSIGRSAVLRGIVNRPMIYPAVFKLEEWEQRARANIATELADLTAAS